MEKTQEQIRFENLYYESMGGFWSHYAPGTMGNILHWLHTYGTLSIAEGVQVGQNEAGENQITWYGRDMLKWKDNPECPDVPLFYDMEYPEFEFIMIQQQVYLDGLKKFTKLVEEINARYAETREWFNRPKASNHN